jgi:hypothetical protein
MFSRDLSDVKYDEQVNTLEYPQGFENHYPLGSNAFLRMDGLIHPADYKNRNLSQLWGRPLMTITKLYADVLNAQNSYGDGIDGLQMRFPQIRPHLLKGS